MPDVAVVLDVTHATDTSNIDEKKHLAIKLGGGPSALVSLPLRYMQSVVEMAHLQDIEHTIQLLTAFAESVKAKDVFRVKLSPHLFPRVLDVITPDS